MALSEDDIRKRLVAGYIGAASRDLKAARAIVDAKDPDLSSTAAYHVQQCAEKLVKAHFAHRGHLITKEHRLEVNLKLMTGEPAEGGLAHFIGYDRFATAARYPSTTGKLAMGPAAHELAEDIEKLRGLLERAREQLGAPEAVRGATDR